MRARTKVVFACAMLAASALACGSAGGSDGDVEVRLDEFTLDAEPASVRSGPVGFEIANRGQIPHEFVVVSTRLRFDRLPVEDGTVVLDAPGLRVVGQEKDIAAGEAAGLELELDAGRYALICNVPAHYQSGMRAPLTVR
jgi:uncharacterized cupredoxin-like copper-binding protein